MTQNHTNRQITELLPGLWQVTDYPSASPLPRNMIILRLPDAGLLIHSAVALDDAGMGELEALGAPRVLVVPNGNHRRDAAFYKNSYPNLLVVCPEAARERVGRAVPVEASAEEALPPLGVVCHNPAGVKPSELTYQFELETGKALVFTDLLFNLQKLPGFGGMLINLIGSSGYFGMTHLGRLILLKDGPEFRQWLLNLSELPDLQAICVAHGDAILLQCAARLEEAARRIKG